MTLDFKSEWTAAQKALTRTWSLFQLAFFLFVEEGDGHGVLIARAGSGKTTVIVEACLRMVGLDVLFVAFNKVIADELKRRVPPNTTASTCHSHGLKSITNSFGRVQVDKYNDRVKTLANQLLPQPARDSANVGAMMKLVSLCKSQLATAANEVESIAEAFSCDAPEGDPRTGVGRVDPELWYRVALDILDGCKPQKKGLPFPMGVSYDDMIWLPVVMNLPVLKFDRVLVDETQDLTPAQLELVLRSVVADGRIFAVGDDRQELYSWAGANSTIARLIKRTGATTLSMPITYRCAKSIVKVANRWVPDLQAADDAIEGCVNHVEKKDLMANVANGDAILSRTNAPLVKICLSLLRAGKRATIRGRDVGAGLAALARKSNTYSIVEFASWLQTYQTRESERLARLGRAEKIDELQDRIDTLVALSEGCATTNELCTRIEDLFSEENGEGKILLSSTHKAKGLEWDRVWLLWDTYRPGQRTEEDNLCYVAVTRAKSELNFVEGVK